MNVFNSDVQKQQPMASVDKLQQQTSLSQITGFSDPVNIISRAALLLTARNCGTRKLKVYWCTEESKVREAALLLKSPAAANSRFYTNKTGEYLINDSLTERGSILLDVPNRCSELVMAAYSIQSIPKLYPIVGLHVHKEMPGIALPPPIPLDLPKLSHIKKVTRITSHQQVVREHRLLTGSGLGTVPANALQKPQSVASSQQQQLPVSQRMDFSDPVSIISRAALFLTAGDYVAIIKLLGILDKHLMLPEDIDMAKEFGQGLANYKNLHYRAAKPCFNALFEKSVNYHGSGNQALASIYLGEIEIPQRCKGKFIAIEPARRKFKKQFII